MKEAQHKKIEAYLGGSMTTEEVLRFEKEMEEDPMLKKEVTLYDQLNHHLGNQYLDETIPENKYVHNLRGFLRSEEAKTLQRQLEITQENYQNDQGTPTSRKYKIAAVIAVLVVLGMLTIVFNNNKEPLGKQLFIEYYTIDDLPNFVSRGSLDNDIEVIYRAFEEENYSETLSAFSKYNNTAKVIDTTLYLYKGMAHLQLEEINRAIVAFDVVYNSELLDNSKGLWFKALAYLKSTDKNSAKKTLEIIASDSTNFRAVDAKKILAKL